MDCPNEGCRRSNCKGKFCPRCGTPINPAPPVRRQSNSGVTSSGVQRRTPSSCSRSAVVASVATAPKRTTSRGRVIAQQMQELADEVYGDTPNDGAQPVDPSVSSIDGGRSQRTRTVMFDVTPLPATWQSGPLEPDGKVVDVSDRNLMCLDVQGYDAVVGSTDHGLKVYNLRTGAMKRNLYTKSCGHSEWVTACKYLGDGRIVTGAMDSKLCLWDARITRCVDLVAHTASISQIEVNENNIVASASYDRTLILWDVSGPGKGQLMTRLSGHKAPVLAFEWVHNNIVSGDRNGTVLLWDVNTSQCVADLPHDGKGHCTAVGYLVADDRNLVVAGDQAGLVTVWDVRASRSPVAAQRLHPGGAIAGLKSLAPHISASPTLVSAGADSRICVCDARRSFEPTHTLTDHKDFIYSLEVLGPNILSGGGNGWLLVHDAQSGKCHYGLGANTAAVRAIYASAQMLVAAGDDGKMSIYNYFS
eukprot:PhM_4_TR8346/c0_g1_i2/m.17824/K10260/FBXW7, SEL10; F-box and WD-40 domain protein 7